MKILTETEISISVVNRLALSGEPFTMEEINTEIRRRFIYEGISLVFLVSMVEYVETMADQGLLILVNPKLSSQDKIVYKGDDNLKLLAELSPNCIEHGQKLDALAMRLNF